MSGRTVDVCAIQNTEVGPYPVAPRQTERRASGGRRDAGRAAIA